MQEFVVICDENSELTENIPEKKLNKLPGKIDTVLCLVIQNSSSYEGRDRYYFQYYSESNRTICDTYNEVCLDLQN